MAQKKPYRGSKELETHGLRSLLHGQVMIEITGSCEVPKQENGEDHCLYGRKCWHKT